MALYTALTRKLGIEHPILLAPMGSASGGKLAAAVSGAGGLGIIGGAYGDPEVLEREFAAAGNIRVGCGFITWALARRPEALDQAISHAAPAIMLSFGDAGLFLSKVRAAGIVAICQVQSLRQAREVLDQGADIIVAQGTEAGGHGAVRATFSLVPAIVDEVARSGRTVPVVAAGGIVDGRGLAAALMLGAEGVLMGTRFYAAEESLAHPAAKARVVAGSGDDTFRTTVFDRARGIDWPSHYTGRALANAFGRKWHGREEALEAHIDTERTHYTAAAAAGDFDTAVIYTGEAIDMIHAIEPAAAIVQRVVAEAKAALTRRFD
jgi:nitronate monooxygenase